MRWYTTTAATALVFAAALLIAGHAGAQGFTARLDGFQETGPLGASETGAILSPATGLLTLSFDRQSSSINYKLSYTGFASGDTVSQAHIHFAKPEVPGGIIVYLCAPMGTGPTGTPSCPPSPGSVSGTLTSASVIGPAGQGIAAGNFAGLVAAIVSGTAYGNVHTSGFPGGEIRGQLHPCQNQGGNGHNHGDDNGGNCGQDGDGD